MDSYCEIFTSITMSSAVYFIIISIVNLASLLKSWLLEKKCYSISISLL